jgi:hypothetical protein
VVGIEFRGREEVKKKTLTGREDVHPQNGLNGLILNWCIGGCWFTPAVGSQIRGISLVKASNIFAHFWFSDLLCVMVPTTKSVVCE